MSDAAGPIGVRGIDHVTLVVADLERSRRFYVDVLGMRQVERPAFAFAFEGRWFQAGRTQIHLILEHDRSGPAGDAADGSLTLSRTHHVAFEVSDGRAAARRLGELGVPLISGPKARPDGAVQVFVRDPDGYVVELCSSPSAVG